MEFGPFRMTLFSGMAGRVLRRSASVESILVGFVLVGACWVSAWWLRMVRAEVVIPVAILVGSALALARFAVEGREQRGALSVFSGNDWGPTVRTALNFITLSLTWLVPLVLLKLQKPAADEFGFDSLFPLLDRRTLTLALLYLAGQMLTPPLLLVVAVDSPGWGGIFSPGRWSRLFGGRGSDLLMLYAVHVGTVAMMLILAAPVLAPVALNAPLELTLCVLFVFLVFMAGLGVSLLGRLCGIFSAFPDDSLEIVPRRAPSGSGPGLSGPVRGGLVTGLAGLNSVSAATPGAQKKPATPSGRPPLLAAREKVAEILLRAASDPGGAIEGLEALHREHAPNPLVLHALCRLLIGQNRRDEAWQVMAEAMPLFLERGNIRLAAEIYREADAAGMPPEVKPERLAGIGLELLGTGDLAGAQLVLERVLTTQPWDRSAIKGLLQVAENWLEREGRPAEAGRIYAWLLERCSDSPLVDVMRRGLDESERRVAAAARRSA